MSSLSASSDSTHRDASSPVEIPKSEIPSSRSSPPDQSRPAKILKLEISSSGTLPSEAAPSKEESDDDLDPCLYYVLGKEKYLEWFNDHGREVDGDELDGELTDAELEQYAAALTLSEGFDVPFFPNSDFCGMITPIVNMTDYDYRTVQPLCIEAIRSFNEQEDKKYEFLELVKANVQACRGLKYYITFMAAEDGNTQTFQAKVLSGIPEKKGDESPVTVYFCRLMAD